MYKLWITFNFGRLVGGGAGLRKCPRHKAEGALSRPVWPSNRHQRPEPGEARRGHTSITRFVFKFAHFIFIISARASFHLFFSVLVSAEPTFYCFFFTSLSPFHYFFVFSLPLFFHFHLTTPLFLFHLAFTLHFFYFYIFTSSFLFDTILHFTSLRCCFVVIWIWV